MHNPWVWVGLGYDKVMGGLVLVIVGLRLVSVCFTRAEGVNCLRAREREGVGGESSSRGRAE